MSGTLRRGGGAAEIGVNKFNFLIDADGSEDAPGYGVEKCFRNLPILTIINQAGVDGLGADPYQMREDAIRTHAVRAGNDRVDGPPVHIQSCGAIGLHALPITLGKAMLGPPGDLAKFIPKLNKCLADFAGQRVCESAGCYVVGHR